MSDMGKCPFSVICLATHNFRTFALFIQLFLAKVLTYNIVNKAGTQISANTLEFGLWGTVIGFVVAAVGMFLINTKNTEKQVEVSAE